MKEAATGLLAPLRGKGTSFWGAVMIAVGGLWLFFKLLPFVLGFVVPGLIVYAGYVLLSGARRGPGNAA